MDMSFILVDDDKINNFINERLIRISFAEAKITTFTNPIVGLEYVTTNFNKPVTNNTFLFLDINMPEMTGWEFMDQINKAKLIAKENLLIYIISSSVDPSDLKKAKNSKNIIDFIEKPLTKRFLDSLKI
ncbi:response regulator [Bacteroidota bacterium]